MKNIVKLILMSFLIFACNPEQANMDSQLLPEDRVEKRLKAMNKNLLKKGQHLKLDGPQVEALRPIIQHKLKALDEANLNAIHPKKRRKSVRDSIRNVWQDDIDKILRPDQREVRKSGFAAPKKNKR